ncbi:hypothetical protein BT69DRAFT_1348425 [Atractiella rhizophila]|nr:hypothetical protein BT69DRAFT_1348425 [Atractiella rhizophila]
MSSEPTWTAWDPLEIQGLVRIAAFSIFTYEFIRTIPAEWRFINRQVDKGEVSVPFILFMLARYVGGQFVERILCWGKFFWETAITVTAGLEIWSTSYQDISIGPHGQCLAGNPHPEFAIAFYIPNVLLDLSVATLTFLELRKGQKLSKGGWHPFSRYLFREGMVYVIIITAGNIVNVVLWLTPKSRGIQSIAATLALVVNINMAQAIVLNLQEKVVRRDGDSESQQRSRTRSRSRTRKSFWNKFWGSNAGGPPGTNKDPTEFSIKVDVVTFTRADEHASATHVGGRGGMVKSVKSGGDEKNLAEASQSESIALEDVQKDKDNLHDLEAGKHSADYAVKWR